MTPSLSLPPPFPSPPPQRRLAYNGFARVQGGFERRDGLGSHVETHPLFRDLVDVYGVRIRVGRELIRRFFRLFFDIAVREEGGARQKAAESLRGDARRGGREAGYKLFSCGSSARVQGGVRWCAAVSGVYYT